MSKSQTHGFITEPTESNNGYAGLSEAMRRESPAPRGAFAPRDPTTALPFSGGRTHQPQAVSAPSEGEWNTAAKAKLRNSSMNSGTFAQSAPSTGYRPSSSEPSGGGTSPGWSPQRPSLGGFASQLSMGGSGSGGGAPPPADSAAGGGASGGEASPRRVRRAQATPARSTPTGAIPVPAQTRTVTSGGFSGVEDVSAGVSRSVPNSQAQSGGSRPNSANSAPSFTPAVRRSGQGGGTIENSGMGSSFGMGREFLHWASRGFPILEGSQREALSDEAASSAVRNPGRAALRAGATTFVAGVAPFAAAAAAPAAATTGAVGAINQVGPRLIQYGAETAGRAAARPLATLATSSSRLARATRFGASVAGTALGARIGGAAGSAVDSAVDPSSTTFRDLGAMGGGLVGLGGVNAAIHSAPRAAVAAGAGLGSVLRRAMSPSRRSSSLAPANTASRVATQAPADNAASPRMDVTDAAPPPLPARSAAPAPSRSTTAPGGAAPQASFSTQPSGSAPAAAASPPVTRPRPPARAPQAPSSVPSTPVQAPPPSSPAPVPAQTGNGGRNRTRNTAPITAAPQASAPAAAPAPSTPVQVPPQAPATPPPAENPVMAAASAPRARKTRTRATAPQAAVSAEPPQQMASPRVERSPQTPTPQGGRGFLAMMSRSAPPGSRQRQVAQSPQGASPEAPPTPRPSTERGWWSPPEPQRFVGSPKK